MSSSRSSPTNTTQTTTNAKETNLAATNTQGITLVGNKGNTSLSSVSNTTNISTDQGAVQAGTELGQLAISKNTGLTQSVESDSFNFANHALDVISTDNANNATLVQNYLAQGASDLNQTESAFTSLEAANANAQNTQFGNIESTLASIAQSNDTSQASQATAAGQQTTTLIIVGVVVIVAAYMLMRKA